MKQTLIKYTPKYAVKPLLKYLKPNSLIWCPFDKKDSNFVKVLSDNGHSIVYTHIEYDENQDFLKINKDDWAFYSGCGQTSVRVSEVDYIISNPPNCSCNQCESESEWVTEKPLNELIEELKKAINEKESESE